MGIFAYFHFRFQGKIEMWVDMFSQRQKVCVSIFAYFHFRFQGKIEMRVDMFSQRLEMCEGILAYFHFQFQRKIEMWVDMFSQRREMLLVYWLTFTSGFRARSRCGWTCFQWTCRLPDRPLTSRPENPRGKRTVSNCPGRGLQTTKENPHTTG